MSAAVVHANGICSQLCGHEEPDPAEVEACRAWLRASAVPTKTITRRHGSYSLKHMVEEASVCPGVTHLMTDHLGRRWSHFRLYVSNGALIAAALLEGYRMQPIGDGNPNAYFNLRVRRRSP